jgi:hypothetical protein
VARIELTTRIRASRERVFDLARDRSSRRASPRSIARATSEGSLVRGAFARFDHDHFFDEDGDVTVARDVFDFDAPLGPLGKVADVLFLERYMRRFLEERMRVLREMAEKG